MSGEVKVYKYTQKRVLKNGEIREYDQIMKKTYVKKPKSEYLPKIKKNIEARISDEVRDEIYKEHLRGKSQAAISEDFGMSIFLVRKVICAKRNQELEKLSG